MQLDIRGISRWSSAIIGDGAGEVFITVHLSQRFGQPVGFFAAPHFLQVKYEYIFSLQDVSSVELFKPIYRSVYSDFRVLSAHHHSLNLTARFDYYGRLHITALWPAPSFPPYCGKEMKLLVMKVETKDIC